MVKFTRLGARAIAVSAPVAVPMTVSVSRSFRLETCGFPGGGFTFLGGLRFFRQPRVAIFRVGERQADFRHARGGARAAAVEDHVGHALAAQQSRALFAQHPGDGVRKIGLPTTIRSDHRRSAIGERQPRAVREGLEAEQFEFL